MIGSRRGLNSFYSLSSDVPFKSDRSLGDETRSLLLGQPMEEMIMEAKRSEDILSYEIAYKGTPTFVDLDSLMNKGRLKVLLDLTHQLARKGLKLAAELIH